MSIPVQRTLGVIGVALTCPCHAVPLLMLLGGTVGAAWLHRHFGVVVAVLGAVFLASLWLLFRPSFRRQAGAADASCTARDRSTP